MGKRYEALFLTPHPESSEEFKKLYELNCDFESVAVSSTVRKKHNAYPMKGCIMEYTMKHSLSRNTYCYSIDFGTVSKLAILRQLIRENRIYHEYSEDVKFNTKMDFLNAFYPREDKWRKRILDIMGEHFQLVLKVFSL